MGEMVGVDKGRKIVVAVDESEESMYALKWCISNFVCRSPSSEDALVILHAKRPTVVYPSFQNPVDVLSHDVLASLDRRDREMASWVIQKALKVCKEHDVKTVEERVEDGNPGDVICDMVKVLEADLLVMGSHGYGLITRTLLESVSSYCVQNASCPVLVVKMPKSTTAAK